MALTEYWLQLWATPPTRDNDKSASTYAIIKPILEKRFGDKVKIFLQWSYANSTNIRKDSDIDIVICYQNSYFAEISSLSDSDKELYNKNRTDATYLFSQFKNDVQICLEEVFWKPPYTERIDKCIRVFWKWIRVDADIVPSFVLKMFKTYNTTTAEWIKLISDKWESIISFPKQHLENGEQKNIQTNKKYKDCVRILKNCKKELIEKRIISEDLISSFFIECLVWNVPNTYFQKYWYIETIKSVLVKIYEDMKNETIWKKYTEVNNIYYLIQPSRTKITKDDVVNFIEKSYSYIFNI